MNDHIHSKVKCNVCGEIVYTEDGYATTHCSCWDKCRYCGEVFIPREDDYDYDNKSVCKDCSKKFVRCNKHKIWHHPDYECSGCKEEQE